jgi:hypothetical protein
MSMMSCKTCKHFDDVDDTGGVCRRYPPVWTPGEAVKYNEDNPARDWSQPLVDFDDVCGEWAISHDAAQVLQYVP